MYMLTRDRRSSKKLMGDRYILEKNDCLLSQYRKKHKRATFNNPFMQKSLNFYPLYKEYNENI
jgi:hypothetical protein